MNSVAEIRRFRLRRKALRQRLDAAWDGVAFGKVGFNCTMAWVQDQLAREHRREAPRAGVRLPGNVTITALQQRRWDARRIAASLFLQALDPHSNVYPDRLFEAQEKAAATSKPPTAWLLGPEHPGIAVLKVSQFATGTADQARAAIDQVRAKLAGKRRSRRKVPGTKLHGLVLDMRGNTGGWVDEALQFADMFMSRGVITSVVSRYDPIKVHRASKPRRPKSPSATTTTHKRHRADLGVPIVVLIDGGCRSSCELVAAALHENDRALVVGARSFGKATVQGVFEARRGPWSVFVTIARYHGPRGESLQRWGVTPDIPIAELVASSKKTWQESKFSAALAPPRKLAPYRSKLLASRGYKKCVPVACDSKGIDRPLCRAAAHASALARTPNRHCEGGQTKRSRRRHRARGRTKPSR